MDKYGPPDANADAVIREQHKACNTTIAELHEDIGHWFGEAKNAQERIAELEGEVGRLKPVVEWAARGPCLCHPANKAVGGMCLKCAADDALAPKEEQPSD